MQYFRHIYVEKRAKNYDTTKRILKHNPNANVIWISHYKDVFTRPRQNYVWQKQNQALILAVRQKDFVYPGASVCQDFGIKNFHYSSCVMNCVCDCEYCYLKGMYPCGHLVVFVNLEDYFKALEGKKIYVCASYDTDLFPLEKQLGYVERWCNFAKENPGLQIEIRTKFKNLDVWKQPAPQNVYFAFSLSPQEIISKYEHKTSSLEARISNICSAQNNGFITRLCFDPIIYSADWKQQYSQLIDQIMTEVDMKKVADISVGTFRISQSYLKNMRKVDVRSTIVNFPFKNVNGYYQYNPTLQKEMEQFVFGKICKFYPKEKVYLWN